MTDDHRDARLSDGGQRLLARARRFFDAEWLAPAIHFVEAEMARDGGHDHGHLWRVLANAERLRRGEAAAGRLPDDVSRDAIVAAALLHDLVNLPKDHPERAQASSWSAEKAVGFLARTRGFPGLVLDRVAEAIRCHSFSSGLVAESAEARLVADADRLESIGAFAVARTFFVHGLMGGQLCDFDDPFAETGRPLDDLSFAVDHFFAKLLRLKERLYTGTARAMAEERHAFMLAFLGQLRDEMPLELGT